MSAVKLNSVVELIEQKDKMPVGRVGRVIWYNDLLCVVSFDEDNDSVDGVRITHNGKGLCEPERPNSAYFVDTNMLKVTTKKTKIKPLVVKICKVCGSAIEGGDPVENINKIQDELINISLLATDEIFMMIEPLLSEVNTYNIGGNNKMVDMYVAMVQRGLKTIDEVPVRYREQVKNILEQLEK